jgi:hypothetical protein
MQLIGGGAGGSVMRRSMAPTSNEWIGKFDRFLADGPQGEEGCSLRLYVRTGARWEMGSGDQSMRGGWTIDRPA